MDNHRSLKEKTLSGLLWVFMERIGAQIVSFVVSIVLARLLLPEEYGVISIVLVFINICNVFASCGFSRALIQKKDADDLDFSSVFYFSFAFSVVLYVALFLAAPFIANFYEMEILTPVLRVMGLQLIVASFNSVQNARVSKNMLFKRLFFSALGGTVLSAIIGVVFAYIGFGVWALVAQNMTNLFINTLVLFVTVKWHPKWMFSFARLKPLFGFGWKVLATNLLDTLYEDFRSLYVGKLYSAADLAYYTRGKQFPLLLVNNINTSIKTVLFPVISRVQNNAKDVKAVTRRSIRTSAYLLTPLLLGLAVVAEPLVRILLTDKWLSCVPYLQILCLNFAFSPLNTANIQAMYAVGRSDVVFKLDIFKKLFGLLMIIIFARISVLAMTWAGLATAVLTVVLNTIPNKKLFNYGLFEQLKDIIPFWGMSGVMVLIVWSISFVPISNIYVELVVKILIGVLVYVLQSIVFKVESFRYIMKTIKAYVFKEKPN